MACSPLTFSLFLSFASFAHTFGPKAQQQTGSRLPAAADKIAVSRAGSVGAALAVRSVEEARCAGCAVQSVHRNM